MSIPGIIYVIGSLVWLLIASVRDAKKEAK